jgi:dihydropteroate synthase
MTESALKEGWRIAGQILPRGERTLVMGVLNVTPDSFSDGSLFFDAERALHRAHEMIAEGADIIDVGGESTRPGAAAVGLDEELRRVMPVVEALARQTRTPISIDTTKAPVAAAALAVGAAIINDVSGLRADPRLAEEAARAGAGLVLMHSRGTPATMQGLPPVLDVLAEVITGLQKSIGTAMDHGVTPDAIAIDPGIGFGKTAAQNLELLGSLDRLAQAFPQQTLLIGTSRKAFIGRLLNDAPATQRLYGTLATVVAAALRGAQVVRVHDVRPAVEALLVADAIRLASGSHLSR